MRKIVIAAGIALTLSMTQAGAGGLALPIMEEEVTEAAAAGSRAGIIVPVLALILLGLAVSNRTGSSGEPPGPPFVPEDPIKILPKQLPL